MARRVVFVDVETTGFDPAVHEVIELALVEAVIVRGRLQPGRRWQWKILPERIEAADPEALRVNGYCPRVWQREGVSASAAWADIAEVLRRCDRPIMAGHNVGFDLSHIAASWPRFGVKPPRLDFRTIDTYAYALPLLLSGQVKSISLTAVRDALGLDTGRAHSAMADALASYELAQWGLRQMRPTCPTWWARFVRRVVGLGRR